MKFLFVGLISLICFANVLAATSPLTQKGRWFVDSAGKGVLLSGGHVWPSVQSDAGMPADYTRERWVDLCVSTNWTFQRLWTFDELLMSHGPVTPLPFARTGPGNAADGGLKIDLATFNEDFFTQLSNHVALLDSKGIWCSVMFFQGVRVNGNTLAWNTNIWNTANNINGVLSARTDVYTMNDSTHYQLATNYVRKVIDTVNHFPNVMYEIGNEMPSQSAAFQSNIVLYVKTYMAALGTTRPVGMTSFDFQSYNDEELDLNPYLTNSPADFWTPEGIPFDNTWRTNPPAWIDPVKVGIIDTDHIWGGTPDTSIFGSPEADARTWVWRAFTRGWNPINQDYPGSGYSDLSVLHGMRKQLGHIQRYARRVKLEDMYPATTMSSKGFILTNSSLEYLAYNPDNSSFTTKLPVGYFYYEKWNTSNDNGGVQEKGTIYNSSAGDYTWFSPGNSFLVYIAPYTPKGGIDFDGVDDRVIAGSPAVLDNLSTSTWMAWVFIRAGHLSNARIVAKETTSGNGASCIFLFDVSGGRLAWARRWSGSFGIWHTPLIVYNTWLHVAITYNAGNTANDPLIYINGVSQTVTEALTPSGTVVSDAADNVTIGGSEDGSQPFDGLIQDVRIFNRILSATDIRAIYNSGSRKSFYSNGLVGHWPMDDGADQTSADGDRVKDMSGRANHGVGNNGNNNTGLTWKSGNIPR